VNELFDVAVVFLQRLGELVDGGGVVVLDAAADGVGEEFFGEGAVEVFFALGGEDVLEGGDISEGFTGDQLAGGVDGLAVFARTEAAEGIEVFEAQADGVHAGVTTAAVWFFTMDFHHLPHGWFGGVFLDGGA